MARFGGTPYLCEAFATAEEGPRVAVCSAFHVGGGGGGSELMAQSLIEDKDTARAVVEGGLVSKVSSFFI
jgi:hypothetical protein